MDTLPGGYWDGSNCHKKYSFKELTGQLELDLADAVTGVGQSSSSVPQLVTSVLSEALDNIDGNPVTKDMVHGLSVPDRQYLMRKLAILLGFDAAWFSKDCSNCAEKFDFQINYSDLPVTPAKEGYPFAKVVTKHGSQKFKVPTGADQEAILKIGNGDGSEKALLKLCHVIDEHRLDGQHLAKQIFSDKDIAKIGSALEEISPGIITNINAGCPECGEDHQIRLDPYFLLQKSIGAQLFHDIHIIAQNYHWNEKEILALSKQRREVYLELIDQEQHR